MLPDWKDFQNFLAECCIPRQRAGLREYLEALGLAEYDPLAIICPIFDNVAGLLSNTRLSQMDISPPTLTSVLRARPFNTTFTRQMNTARGLYGKQLSMPKLTAEKIRKR